MTVCASSNIENCNVKYLGISLAIFAYYSGDFSIVFWLASVLILSVQVRRLPDWLLAYTVLLTLFFAGRMLLETSAAEDILRDARFYWGFVIFLPFFISEQRQLGPHYADYTVLFRFLINLCLILLLIEFLTTNFLHLEWPNRAHDVRAEIETGSLVRAYGFGSNASVTSTLLIALSALLYKGKLMRDVATLALTASGTGFLLWLLKSALMLKRRYLFMAAAFFAVLFNTVWVGLLESGLNDTYSALSKFSLDYLFFLLDFKYEQFEAVMAKTSGFQLVFGQPITIDSSLRTGDFQLLDFLYFNGLFGIGMLMLIVAKFMNKTNRIPLLLLLLATAHYQVIFSLPGQILFAWLLTVGIRVSEQKFVSTGSLTAKEFIEHLTV